MSSRLEPVPAERERPQFKLQDHQRDVLDYLDDTRQLVERAGKALQRAGRRDEAGRYADFAAQLAAKRQEVEALELRMAVVAPMKAGKSTLVNAIIGEDLLPHRNAAMTAVPTEIVGSPGTGEPVLRLSEGLTQVYAESITALRNAVGGLGDAEAAERVREYPHLEPLLRALARGEAVTLRPSIEGTRCIQQVLMLVNDVNRLCSVFAPGHVPVNELDPSDIPRIECAFWDAPGRSSETCGSLVVVDTPGPNEATVGVALQDAVVAQLQRCSMVLLVLDYMQLNGQAAAELREKVRPVVDVLGTANLFVVVNRIDQRIHANDLNPEQVRAFVAAHLGLEGLDLDRRLFEMSAARAFEASSYIRAYHQLPGASLEQLAERAEPLLKRTYPLDWEEKLAEERPDEVAQVAERVWKKSGIDAFLAGAITWLLGRVAPEAMTAALKIAAHALGHAADETALRGRALAADASKLAREVERLDAQLRELDTARSEIAEEVDSRKKALGAQLQQLVEEMKLSAAEKIADHERKLTTEGERKGFFERIADRFGGREAGEAGTKHFVFTSGADADRFITEASEVGRGVAVAAFRNTHKRIHRIVGKVRSDLFVLAKKRALPIVQRARANLENEFDVRLELPELEMSEPDLPELRFQPTKKTRVIEGERVRKTRYVRRWYTLYLYPHKVSYTVKQPDQRVHEYVIDLSGVVAELNRAIEQSVLSVREQLDAFVDEEFHGALDGFLQTLEGVLADYRRNLADAKEQQTLTVNEQEELVRKLSLVGRDLRACEARGRKLSDRTNLLSRAP